MFRKVTGEDRRNLQALVDAQRDLLESCPVDSLLRPSELEYYFQNALLNSYHVDSVATKTAFLLH